MSAKISIVIVGLFAGCSVYSAEICDFSVRQGEENSQQAQVLWISKPGTSYTLESANAVTGTWHTVSNENSNVAQDFLSAANVRTTSSAQFFRVLERDTEGPALEFVSPTRDTVAVPTNSDIVVELSDATGIDWKTLSFVVNGRKIDNELLDIKDGEITYRPSNGVLGWGGDKVRIDVSCADVLGNLTEDASTIRLARPFSVIASRILCLADADVDFDAYCILGGEKVERGGMYVTSTESDRLTVQGANAADFCEGAIVSVVTMTNILYRKVVSARVEGQEMLCVMTTTASLSDIFSGSIDTGCELTTPMQNSPVRTKLLKTHKDTGLKSISPLYLTFGSEMSKTLGQSAAVSISGEVNLQMNGAYSFKGDFGLFTEDDYDFFFQGQVFLRPSVTIGVSKTLKSYEKKKKFKIISFPIVCLFGVPVVIVSGSLEATLNGALNVTGSFTAEAELGVMVRINIRRRDGEWHALAGNEIGGVCNGDSNFNFDGGLEVELSFGPRIDIGIFDLVGPYMTCGPYIKGMSGVDVHGMLERKVIAGLKGTFGHRIGSRDIEWGSDSAYRVLFSDSEKQQMPNFVDFPSSLCVENGKNVTFSSFAAGTEPITYIWYKDGRQISFGRDLSFWATKDSAGMYTCEAKNILGSDFRNLELEVTVKPTMDAYVGTWRQIGVNNNAAREFHVRSNGEGYYQLIEGGIAVWSKTDFPITCAICDNGELQIDRGGAIFFIQLTREGEGRLYGLRLATGEHVLMNNSHIIRRISRNP